MKKFPAPLLILPLLAFAQGDAVWTGDISPDWNTPGNWDPGVPGVGDRAVFTNDACAATAQANAVAQLAAGPGALTLELGATLAVTNNLTLDGPATLNLESGLLAVTNNAADAILRVGESTAGNIFNAAENTTLHVDILRVGETGFSKFNQLNFAPGALLTSHGMFLGIGNGSTDNRHVFNACVVTNWGELHVATQNDNCARTTMELHGATFHNTGLFRFGKFNSNQSKIWLGTGTHMSVGGAVELFRDISSSGFVVSNATLTIAGQLNTDSGGAFSGCRMELHQDTGHQTVVNANANNTSIQLKHAANTPIIVYGGTLNAANDINAANGGSNSYVGIIGTNSVVNCRSYYAGSYSGSGFGLVISNGVLNCAATCHIGYNGNGATRNNTVISGPFSRVNANALLMGNNVSGNTLSIDGGTVQITGGIILGNNTSRENTVAISHPSTRVTGGTLTIKNASILEFLLPADGFDATPVAIAGAAEINDDTMFHVDAAAFQKAGGNGWVTLVEAGALNAPLTHENVTLTLHGRGPETPDASLVDFSGNAVRVKIPDIHNTVFFIK